jgi:hypothetical protein
MATAYIVAATPSSRAPKRIANLKSAKREADARAKLDRVDVEVRTESTGKLSYTAQGAPTVEAPAAPEPQAQDETPQPVVIPAPRQPADDAEATATGDADQDGEGTIDMSGFEAVLAGVVNDDQDDAPQDDDAPAATDDQDEPQDDQGDAPAPADDNGGHRGQAECGCSVEKIIATGEHGKGCADAPKEKEAAKAVERDRPARPARKAGGGGSRRESQGASVADGWELLYDKPKQKAQVGRNGDGKYALICTMHKHAHQLTRLVQERGLRGGKRSVWCPQCTD